MLKFYETRRRKEGSSRNPHTWVADKIQGKSNEHEYVLQNNRRECETHVKVQIQTSRLILTRTRTKTDI
jgi:hypothetical protein